MLDHLEGWVANPDGQLHNLALAVVVPAFVPDGQSDEIADDEVLAVEGGSKFTEQLALFICLSLSVVLLQQHGHRNIDFDFLLLLGREVSLDFLAGDLGLPPEGVEPIRRFGRDSLDQLEIVKID